MRYRSFKAGAIAAAILVMSMPALPQSEEEFAKDPDLFLSFADKAMKWSEGADPIKIAGPLYFVGTKGLSVFLLMGSQGGILINTGMPSSGPMIEESIRKLGFDPKTVKIVLASHAHVDHVGGHAYIKKLTGAQVGMMSEDAALLASGGKEDFFYRGAKSFEYEPVTPDFILRDGDVVKLGDLAVTALLTPGHTKGSTTWTTMISDNGVAYSVVIADGVGVNPGYRLANPPSYPGIDNDYRRTYHRLEMLKPDIWLTLHNEAYGFAAKSAKTAKEGVKAWVDPDGYRKFVATSRARFETVMDRNLAAP